jgi:FSR family fosmidomycin resistance protein-like MFS transporter
MDPASDLPPPGLPPEDGDGRFRPGTVVALSAGHASHDTYTNMLPVLLPSFVERFALTNTAAGALAAFVQFPSILQPFFGYLADHRNLRWMVVLGPGSAATLMCLVGWAPAYAVLALLLTAAGISSAAFHAVASATAGRASRGHLGKGLSIWMVGGEVGSTLGPLVAAAALSLTTLKGLLWLMPLGWTASFILNLALRRLPQHAVGGTATVHWRPALRAMRKLLLLVGGLVALRAMALSAPRVFGPLYLQQEGASPLVAGASVTVFLAAGVVGTITAGWVSDRLGRRVVLLTGVLVGPTALLLFALSGGWVRFPLLFLAGAATESMHPACMALVQETFPESRGLANALYLSTVFVMSSVAAVAVGALGDGLGLRWAFVISALVVFLSLPLILSLARGREAAQPG